MDLKPDKENITGLQGTIALQDAEIRCLKLERDTAQVGCFSYSWPCVEHVADFSEVQGRASKLEVRLVDRATGTTQRTTRAVGSDHEYIRCPFHLL